MSSDEAKERVPTGVEGLDDLMGGGLPKGTVNLVCGPAGCGKTLFGIQYVYRGAIDHGEPGIFLSVEESRSSIERASAQYGFDLDKAQKDGKLIILDVAEVRKRCQGQMGEEELIAGFDAISKLLTGLARGRGIKRIAMDSVTGVCLYYGEDQTRLRREMFRFMQSLRDLDGVTSCLIAESSDRTGETPRYHIEQFLADSHVSLGLERVSGEYRRTISVTKMRFGAHDSITHPLLITGAGLEVEPETRVR
ncbi:MAG TPA: ATPase domain-containing protein [Thermoplasmata archaeon]|nr:ATPase domain-containing protein [Thermoplasmata archaeon]